MGRALATLKLGHRAKGHVNHFSNSMDGPGTFAMAASVTTALLAQSAAPQARSTTAASAPVMPAPQVRAALDRYCMGCHNPKLKTAGLTLDSLDAAHIADHDEVGEKVVHKLRAGMMPPSGMPRPDAATYASLIGEFERQLDTAAAAKPQRWSRRERTA